MQDVRLALDENRTDTALLTDGDVDTLNLDSIIKEMLCEGIDRVHAAAPYYMLEGTSFATNTLTFNTDDTAGNVRLPDDFLRLVMFKMSDWERPVFEAISTLDPAYAKQRSRNKGIRGTAQRPVCVISAAGVIVDNDTVQKKILEFYSCKSRSATVEHALYIPRATFSDTSVNISTDCYRAAVYMIAALTLTSIGEVERAKNFFDITKSYLEKQVT